MKKILVADDDRTITDLLGSVLKDSGYEVKTVSDGVSALRIIRDFKPDLLLMDVMMPLMTGHQVCKTLSEDPVYEPLPKIIMLTVRKSEQDKKLSEFAGADFFVPKPFDTVDLLKKIKRIIG